MVLFPYIWNIHELSFDCPAWKKSVPTSGRTSDIPMHINRLKSACNSLLDYGLLVPNLQSEMHILYINLGLEHPLHF